ncbi:MAG TPA: phage holin family protein [Burkholderiales bacterium]|nr:phage holin family protein [Burkholderiales bacterium]
MATPTPGTAPGRVIYADPALSASLEEEETSLLEPLQRAWSVGQRLLHDYATLAVLDVRRAAVQLAWLVGAAVVISVLVVGAWMAGVTALIAYLLAQHISWPIALIAAAVLNLIGAAIVLWRLRAVMSDLPFAATLRQLKAQEPPREPS